MWRRHTIAAAETLSDTEVWEYQLPTSGILNGVLLHIENTNGGTDNLMNPIYKAINAIQLVDGGRVLLDVTGVQAEMLSLVATGGEPRSKVREAPGETQTYQALLLFGNKLWDNDLGLDLSKLTNPKLRVDLDFTNTRAVGVTGFVSGAATMSAVLLINDGSDQPNPASYLKSHEIKRWTTAPSGDEVTQGPVDGAWSRLFVRAHVAGSCPDDVLTDIKLSFDAGQLVAIDEQTKWQSHAYPMMFGRYPRIEFTLYRQSGETVDLEHASIQSYTGASVSADELVNLATIGCGNVTTRIWDISGTAASTNDENRTINIWPVHPYMSFVYDFSPMGLLKVADFQRADIVLTQAVASAAASIVLQQIMENKTAA